jgi:transcriptional regulator with XRE-family HTH domain
MTVKVEDKLIGGRLKLRRTQLGVSQQALGRFEKLTFQQIQKYETGANRISAGRLYKFAKILHVDVDYFYDGLDKAVGSDFEINANDRLTQVGIRRLNKYYLSIKNPKIKKSIVVLTKQLSEAEIGDQGRMTRNQKPETRHQKSEDLNKNINKG